ncbi:MAG: 1-acyl-sn-glycerol-3-phosphate acyltransferase [Chloroflexi bacterium]|nr:1-acyl-sn-glycerol-3-phosphate acyltransferase [Chloroflexota bacterium]
MKRATLQRIVRFLMHTLTKTQFLGLDNIPLEGGLIIAINHLSYIDIPLIFTNPRRPDITALITTKYQTHPFIRWFSETAEGIWIDRDVADFTAIRKASQALAEGKAVGISPEGTRSHTHQLAEGKPGTAMLALKAGVPIVPVGIQGTEFAIDRLKHLRKPHMIARFGQSFTLPPIQDAEKRAEILQRYTEEIMCRIAVLLPEKYQGFYRDHPRLKEFAV